MPETSQPSPCAIAHFFPGYGSFSDRMSRADRGDRIGEVCACGRTRIVALGPFGAIAETEETEEIANA